MANACNSNLSTSDVLVNFKCCICAKKNITQAAEKYCVECQNYFCLPCTELHSMIPCTAGHTLLDKAEFPIDWCVLHETQLMNKFCVQHDEIACDSCVLANHSTCQDIRNIAEEIDELCQKYRKSTLVDITRQLASAITTMKDIKKTKENLLEELKEFKKNAVDSVKDMRKEMEAVLEKLEKESIKDIEAEYEKAEAKLLKEMKKAATLIDDIEQSADKLKNADGNKAKEFVSVKNAEKNLIKIKEAEKFLTVPKNVKINFLSDSKIQTILQQLKKFREVVLLNLYKITWQTDINVKLSNESSTSYIHGSCMTEDGSLLLADYYNKKLKCVDLSTHSVKDQLYFMQYPFDVCQTKTTEAAVSLYHIKTIQFVSLGNKMTATRQLQLDHKCWGLACKDDKLFISDYNATVYIRDMNGTMIHKVTADQSGNAIFSATRHISLSTSGDMLYVADQNKGLITLDIMGNYVSTFNDPDLVNLHGVCTDRRGNIFVCGLGDSKIGQINEEYKTKVFMIDNITNSYSACFDRKQNKLVVTGGNTDTVKVYKLELARGACILPQNILCELSQINFF